MIESCLLSANQWSQFTKLRSINCRSIKDRKKGRFRKKILGYTRAMELRKYCVWQTLLMSLY